MPSIEILLPSVDAVSKAQYFSNSTFQITASFPATSHRQPSLFQYFFEKNPGTLLHLGRDKNGWFDAYEIITLQSGSKKFGFKNEFECSVREILLWAVGISPCGLIYFSSDYQYCNSAAVINSKTISVDHLIQLSSAQNIRLNTCLPVRGNKDE